MCDFRDLEVTELKVRHRQLGYIYISYIYIWEGLGHDVRCVSWYMNTQRHYSYFTEEEHETQTGKGTAQGQ